MKRVRFQVLKPWPGLRFRSCARPSTKRQQHPVLLTNELHLLARGRQLLCRHAGEKRMNDRMDKVLGGLGTGVTRRAEHDVMDHRIQTQRQTERRM